MDPVKKDGKVREQAERENEVRRKYSMKWGEIGSKDINKFRNQHTINEHIRQSGFKEHVPYAYTGHGDSYFVSKNMYESLLAKCRCGRPRADGHITKCLQRVKFKYPQETIKTAACTSSSGIQKVDIAAQEKGKISPGEKSSVGRIPPTSCGLVGWLPNRYAEWEYATHYISPKMTMPGYRIDDHPYTTIFIG